MAKLLCGAVGVFLLSSASIVLFLCVDAHAAPPSPPPSVSPTSGVSAAPTASPVPLSEVVSRLEESSATLETLRPESRIAETMGRIAERLELITQEITSRLRESLKVVQASRSLEQLRSLHDTWSETVDTLKRWEAEITGELSALETNAGRAEELRSEWQQTKDSEVSQAPPEVQKRVDQLLSQLKTVSQTLVSRRSDLIGLQSRVNEQRSRASRFLTSITKAQERAVQGLFIQDSDPVWREGYWVFEASPEGEDDESFLSSQLSSLIPYLARKLPHMIVQFLLFGAFAVALKGLRRALGATLAETDSHVRPLLALLDRPWHGAALLALAAGYILYPDAPRVLGVILHIATLIPGLFLLRAILPMSWDIATRLTALRALDDVRLLAAGVPALAKLLFIVEILALVVLAWPRSFAGLPVRVAPPRPPTPARPVSPMVWLIAQALRVAALAALAANLLGFAALSYTAISLLVSSSYYGIILAAAVAVLLACIRIAIDIPPLSRLSVISANRERFLAAAFRVLAGAALLVWTLDILDALSLRALCYELLSGVFGASVTLGALSISLGNVIAFVLTVWGSFALSRLVRYILREEIYARVSLPRGLPYAISTLTHYAILLVGFFFAIAVLGIDMTKFTILAGAFGVGVGLGLQSIVNNFFSGLIVLFERPIRVGDVIQMDDVEGQVERIGIRASFVRTPHGSEVIIPNAKFISDRVTNWTFSNRQRAIVIPINVAYSVGPGRIMALLETAAYAHPKVAREPKPQVLLVKVNADSISVELRVFTEQYSEWARTRSELLSSIYDKLVQENIEVK